jgi:hypothetical protein
MSEKSGSKPKITFFRLVVLGLIALAIVSAINDKPDGKTEAKAAAPAPAAATAPDVAAVASISEPAPPPPLPVPGDQTAFRGVIDASREAYDAAANELAKGGERPKRGQALCQTVKSRKVTDWVGKVYRLSTNSEGRGVLSLELDGDIWVSTWNIALADIGSDTLIDPASDLFRELSTLSEGDLVVFSGSFFADGTGTDCFAMMGLTMDSAMSQPEYVFAFTDVRPAP